MLSVCSVVNPPSALASVLRPCWNMGMVPSFRWREFGARFVLSVKGDASRDSVGCMYAVNRGKPLY